MAKATRPDSSRGQPDASQEPERSAFFGREEEIAAVVGLLTSGSRLVTLTGPGGIGKTRLARRVLTSLAPEAGGAWFCPCALATDAASMIAAAARALDLAPGAAPDLTQARDLVGRALAGHHRPLVVLDNLEQALPAACDVVSSWMDAAPECSFLVTSRELLRIEGERVYELGSLPEAVELFLDRARMIQAGYASSEAELRTVTRLVARLDGIPLAVELAAARARVLSPAALQQQLEARIETLAHGQRLRAARQSTMSEAVAWSWELLEAAEQQAMAALSVFRGDFGLPDAQRILADTIGASEGEALELVQALRDKSLLHAAASPAPDGSVRFGMYEVVRAYGRAKLEAGKWAAGALDAHARYFVERGERLLQGCPPDRLEASLERLGFDRENLESVLKRGGSASTEPAPEMLALSLRSALLLGAVAGDDGLPPHQLDLLERLLERPAASVAPGLWEHARLVRATSRVYAGRPAQAEQDCLSMIQAAQQLGDERLAATAHLTLGAALLRQGKALEALAALRAAESLCRAAGDVPGEQHALCQQGGCAQSLQRGQEALILFERGLELARAWGLVRGQIRAEAGLGSHYLEAGDYDRSLAHLERCGQLARAARFHRTSILVMGHLGILNFDHDRLGEALECLTAAVAEAGETGDDVPQGVFLAVEAAARATMGDVQGAVPLAARARRVLDRSPLFRVIVQVYAAHVELAAAAQLHGGVDSTLEAQRQLKAASSARLGDMRLVEQSDDLRVALRILERAIVRRRGQPTATEAAGPRALPVLVVAQDASWFQLDAERRVDMSRRTNSRAILQGLVEHSAHAGRAGLSVDELLAVGWPGEKMARSSALNRLYVALATLRSLGLRDVIVRGPDGYVLVAEIRRG